MTSPDLNSISIEDLEKELARRKEMQAKQTELDRLYDEALAEDVKRSEIITLHSIRIAEASERIFFRIAWREDIVNFMREYRWDRTYNGTENAVPFTKWSSFINELVKLKNVRLDLTAEEWALLAKFKPKSDFTIRLEYQTESDTQTAEPHRFAVYVKPHKAFTIQNVLSAEWVTKANCFHIKLINGWRLIQVLMKDVTENHASVDWDDEAYKICSEQLEYRMELDKLALDDSDIEPVVLNKHLLKPFQAQGVRYIIKAGGNGILGHEMGLGKTPMAIAIAEHYRKYANAKRVVVVCPASLKVNWAREIYKFTGEQAYLFSGSKPSQLDIIEWIKSNRVYFIINYDIIGEKSTEKETVDNKVVYNEHYHWAELINLVKPDVILADELHYIKSPDSQRSKGLRELEAPHKIGMSGTLLVNHPQELHPPIQWIEPELAGSFEGWVSRYVDRAEKRVKNIDELREVLKAVMIRKTKRDVYKELEPINRIIRSYELSPSARVVYEKALNGFWIDLAEWDGDHSNTQAIAGILAQLMKLKQICSQDKVTYIADLAQEAYDNNNTDWRKVIIFSQFVNTPSIVQLISDRLGKHALHFTGNDDSTDRQRIVDRFQNEDDKHFLVASTKAAAEGLNITAAGTVIFADLMWTPKDHNQAEGRAYGRISDMHTIDSYYVIASGTVEEDPIMPILENKMALFNEIIEGSEEARHTTIAMEVIKALKGKRLGG